MTENNDRTACPNCDNDDTEFVQFATGEEKTVETPASEVGDGLLELRSCDQCRSGIEIILRPEDYTVVNHE